MSREVQTNRKKWCCQNGTIEITPKESFPEKIRSLFEDPENSRYENFHRHIRKLNNLLSLASMKTSLIYEGGGLKFSDELIKVHGSNRFWTLKIGGLITHSEPVCGPSENKTAKNSQLYFYDPEIANSIRYGRTQEDTVDAWILREFDKFIREVHPCVREY